MVLDRLGQRETVRLKAFSQTDFTFAQLQAENGARSCTTTCALVDAKAIRDNEIDGCGSTSTWSRR